MNYKFKVIPDEGLNKSQLEILCSMEKSLVYLFGHQGQRCLCPEEWPSFVLENDEENMMSHYYKYLKAFWRKDLWPLPDFSRFDEYPPDCFCGFRMEVVGDATLKFLNEVHNEMSFDNIKMVLESMIKTWDTICFG